MYTVVYSRCVKLILIKIETLCGPTKLAKGEIIVFGDDGERGSLYEFELVSRYYRGVYDYVGVHYTQRCIEKPEHIFTCTHKRGRQMYIQKKKTNT